MSDGRRILLLEGISSKAKELLEREGYQVRLESYSPDEKQLIEWLKDTDALGIRSKTQVTRRGTEANPHLLVVGAFCIGTTRFRMSARTSWVFRCLTLPIQIQDQLRN